MGTALTDFNPRTFFDKTAHYASQGRGRFSIIKPEKIASGDWNNDLSTGILAKGFNLGSMQLGTYEPFSYVGPTTKHAYGMTFPDIDVEFYLVGKSIDEARQILNTFINWMEYIAGPTQPNHILSSSMIDPFTVQYYQNYITQAVGEVFSPSDPQTPIIQITFRELYPVAINPIQTSWESPDAPVSLSVTFCYYYQEITRIPNPPQTSPKP